MAFGDENDGTLFLYEVPVNLRNMQENEEATMTAIWQREIEKCEFVKTRRVQMKEDYLEVQKEEEKQKALEDQAKEN